MNWKLPALFELSSQYNNFLEKSKKNAQLETFSMYSMSMD